MKLLAALALPAATMLALAFLGMRLVGEPQPRAQRQPTAIVWGDRVFASRAQLARWLRARGVDYLVWSRRHPIRAGLAPLPAAPAEADGGSQPSPWPAGGAALLLAAFLLGSRRRGWARLLRRATRAGRASCEHAGTAVLVAWHERRELAWYAAGALLVAAGALVATAGS